MFSTSDFETIKDIVISAVPSVESIFLFGSYAKGTAREQSDIDIAVLLEHELGWREVGKIMADARRALVHRGRGERDRPGG